MADTASIDRPPPTSFPPSTELAGVVGQTAPALVEPKAGVRTSELYIKLLADALTVAYASGWIPTSGIIATVVAIIATQLTALGYQVIRAQVKQNLTTQLTAAIIGKTAVSLLVGGLILAACLPGSTVRRDTSIGVVAAASCEVGAVSAQDVHDVGVWANDKVQGWIAGTTPGDLAGAQAKILADLKPLQGQLLPCLINGIVAAIEAPPNPSSGSSTATQALSLAAPDAAHTVAIAFQLAARQAGWPRISTPGGAQ